MGSKVSGQIQIERLRSSDNAKMQCAMTQGREVVNQINVTSGTGAWGRQTVAQTRKDGTDAWRI